MNKVESEEGTMEEEVEEANREKEEEEEEEDPKTREEVNPVAKIAGENFQKVFLRNRRHANIWEFHLRMQYFCDAIISFEKKLAFVSYPRKYYNSGYNYK